MKREDAIEIEAAFVRRDSEILGTDDRVSAAIVQALAAVNVDRLIAFGMLKLDEPKKHNKAFCRAYNTLDEEGHHAAQILSLLDEAGLKIIEK